jgi:PAS domain S-box-containing protein
MASGRIEPTGVERTFSEDELIVSKTDLTGRITYANDVFLRVSCFAKDEIIGQPHSTIRHPDMPRAIFHLLWQAIRAGRECFAYVCNLSKDGSHYWVLAHVTPTFDAAGRVIGYHSSRRVPDREALREVQKLYRELREIERLGDRREGLERSVAHLQAILDRAHVTYDEWVWGLTGLAGASR